MRSFFYVYGLNSFSHSSPGVAFDPLVASSTKKALFSVFSSAPTQRGLVPPANGVPSRDFFVSGFRPVPGSSSRMASWNLQLLKRRLSPFLSPFSQLVPEASLARYFSLFFSV